MLAYVKPFRRRIGEWVAMETYNGGLDEIREQVDTENVVWDVVDFELSDLIRGCREGLLETIDHGKLAAGGDGTPAAEDFIPGALTECGVGQMVWATVVGYDGSRFEGDRPAGLADFFDVKKFPGKRGLRRDPRVAMEWALMADGVAPAEVCLRHAGNRGRPGTGVRRSSGQDQNEPRVVDIGIGAGSAPGFGRSRHDLRMERPHVSPDGRGRQGLRHRLGRTALGHRFLGGSPRAPTTSPRRWISSASPRAPSRWRSRRGTSPTGRRGSRRWPWWMRGRRRCCPTATANMASALQTDAGWWATHHADLSAKMEQWLAKGGRGLSGSAR